MVELVMDEIELVRLLIPDIDPNNQIFSNDQIAGYIVAANGNRYRAASLAVGALSVDEAVTYKVIKTDDQSINGAAVAAEIRKRAQDLEYLARREDELSGEAVFIVSYPQPQITAPELIPVAPNDLPYWEAWRGHC